jgi:hypothetical protein
MNFNDQEKVIEYINSLVSSSLNKILYNLPVEKDIEIVIIDENKSFGYVVLYLPVQDENINLGYIPFVTDYSYCKFLFLQVQDEVYPLESKYIERLIPPQILQQLREQQTLNKTSEYKNYKETAQDIMYSKYSERRLEKIKNIIKNLKKSEKKLIPKSIKEKIQSKSEREKMPAHYFLMPKERKFPVKDPTTGKYHCGLIRAAITRAAQHKYEQVERKARKLYEKHCKNKKSSSDILLELNYVNDKNYISNYLYKHSEYIDENTLSYIMPYLINPYDLPQNNINLSPLLVYYILDKTSNFLDYENNVKTSGAGTVLALLAGLGIMGALGFAGYKYMKHHEDYNNKHLQLFGKEASFMDKLMGSVFHGGDLLKHKFGISEKEFELNLNKELLSVKDARKNTDIAEHVGYVLKKGSIYNILGGIKDDRRFEDAIKNKNYKKLSEIVRNTDSVHDNLESYYKVDITKIAEQLKKDKEFFTRRENEIKQNPELSNEEKIIRIAKLRTNKEFLENETHLAYLKDALPDKAKKKIVSESELRDRDFLNEYALDLTHKTYHTVKMIENPEIWQKIRYKLDSEVENKFAKNPKDLSIDDYMHVYSKLTEHGYSTKYHELFSKNVDKIINE